MTETNRRLIIAGAVAALLIAGSLTAIAVTGDSDDDDPEGLFGAITEKFDEDFESEDLLGGALKDFFGDGDGGERLAAMLLDLLKVLGRDLDLDQGHLEEDMEEFAVPRRGDDDLRDGPGRRGPRFSERDRDERPGPRDDRFRGELPFGMPFFEGSPLEEFLRDGQITPEEAEALHRWFMERFASDEFRFDFEGFGEEFPRGFGEFGFPFGDLPLDEFLHDGHISPDEAAELEHLFRQSVPGGIFRFEFVPPDSDRPRSSLSDALLEGLRDLPFREFFADGELTLREREELRRALNHWLDMLFERLDASNS